MKSSFKMTDLLYFAVMIGLMLLLSNIFFGFFGQARAPIAEKRGRCAKMLRDVYELVEKNPPRVESDHFQSPRPFHLDPYNHYCPVIDYLTRQSVRSPFLLTYAIKQRGADEWKPVDLERGPLVPLVFVSELLAQGGDWNEGWVCYSDGSVKLDVLPLFSWPIVEDWDTEDNIYTVEISFEEDGPRFPYAKHIAAIRCQYLGRPY